MTFLQRLLSLPRNSRHLPGLVVAGIVLVGLLGSSCTPRTEAEEDPLRYTDAELMNYARSRIEIENARDAAVEQIQELSGTEEVPAIACSEPDSLDGQPKEVRTIAVDFCTQSLEIVRDNELNTKIFNDITQDLPEDPELAEKVKTFIRQLLATEHSEPGSESLEEKG